MVLQTEHRVCQETLALLELHRLGQVCHHLEPSRVMATPNFIICHTFKDRLEIDLDLLERAFFNGVERVGRSAVRAGLEQILRL